MLGGMVLNGMKRHAKTQHNAGVWSVCDIYVAMGADGTAPLAKRQRREGIWIVLGRGREGEGMFLPPMFFACVF